MAGAHLDHGATPDRLWLWSRVDCLGETNAVTLVGADGSQRWLLVDPDHQCHGCPIPDTPAHELTGPLPAAVVDRLERCNAPTCHGAPCRNRAGPGDRCHHHRGVADG